MKIHYLGYLGFLGPLGLILYSSTGNDLSAGLTGFAVFFAFFMFPIRKK